MPNTNLNAASRAQAHNRVGDQLVWADELARWLYEHEAAADGISFRFSPCLTTRSEAELLGLSQPRFAIRAYLNPEGSSFLNLRRLNELAECISSVQGYTLMRLGYSLLAPHLPRPLTKSQLHTIVSTGTPFADSLITPPPRLASCVFSYATLGKAYSEPQVVRGVPFMQHLTLGGGLCAQACCMMAISTLHDYANSVPGVAELTTLAGSVDGRPNPLTDHSDVLLGGLNTPQTINALESKKVGLSSNALTPTFYTKDNLNDIRVAVKSYIDSGCVLIAPNDLGRLFGHTEDTSYSCNVMKRNNVPFRIPNQQKHQSHAVLLNGYNPKDSSFYINDPASFPFINITLEELIHCRRYKSNDTIDRSKPKNLAKTELDPFTLISVAPAGVQLPLLEEEYWTYDSGKAIGNRRTGLLQIAHYAQTLNTGLDLPKWRQGSYEPGRFRLLSCSSGVRNQVGKEVPCDLYQPLESFLESLGHGQVWVWLQSFASQKSAKDIYTSYWIWNAQRPGSSYPQENPWPYLLGCFIKGPAGWTLKRTKK